MTEQKIDPLEAEAKAAAEKVRMEYAERYFETLAKIDPSPEMARIIERAKARLAKREVASATERFSQDAPTTPVDRVSEGMIRESSADEREALRRIISETENLTDGEGAWALPEDVADAILAAGFHRRPQPTEGEPSARDLFDAIYDPEEDGENDSVRIGFIIDQFERLRAARVADQGGER